MKRQYIAPGLVCIARDASQYRWKDRRHFSSEESFQVEAHEEPPVVGMYDRMEGFNAADVDVVQDAGRDEDIVQPFGAAAVSVRFALETVVAGMYIDKVALSDEVAEAVGSVAKAFIKISAEDDLDASRLLLLDGGG